MCAENAELGTDPVSHKLRKRNQGLSVERSSATKNSTNSRYWWWREWQKAAHSTVSEYARSSEVIRWERRTLMCKYNSQMRQWFMLLSIECTRVCAPERRSNDSYAKIVFELVQTMNLPPKSHMEGCGAIASQRSQNFGWEKNDMHAEKLVGKRYNAQARKVMV